MKKRLMCLAMALLMCGTQVVSVSASREEELREEQAWTSQQLDATYARMDELWAAKQQLESEIATLDANLVDVMVSIDVLKNDISAKEVDIVRTKQDLGKAQKARDKQYEAMKKRIQYLYEKGGDDAWFQMMMNAENLSDLLTRAEYTQKMYDQDRKSLEKYVNTIEEVKKLQTKYESEQAELEEMKASYEEQSVVLQNEIDARRASSANCDAEIAYAQQQATEYANLIAEQQAEIERLEAERIAAEEAARRAAEEEAARLAAEQAAQEEAENEEVQYDEDGNVIEDTESTEEEYTEESESSEDVEYDEYGNVIDSDNTVSQEEYESQDTPSYSGSGSSVVDFATQFVGNPYVWGGTSLTGGADCSGFTQSVYANFGVSIPRTSYEQQNAGYEVPYSEAQPGDLICYGGHVAIYMGNGQIVHASNSRDGIKISNDATYRTILSVRRLV
ncbi:MAG: C40 family peptidase [Clostridiales bacterium]|nr:C40 family peptidase [Clostridiales bacterium]